MMASMPTARPQFGSSPFVCTVLRGLGKASGVSVVWPVSVKVLEVVR